MCFQLCVFVFHVPDIVTRVVDIVVRLEILIFQYSNKIAIYNKSVDVWSVTDSSRGKKHIKVKENGRVSI